MSKEYDLTILTELDDHISNIMDLLTDADMSDDSANGFRDQVYQYFNRQQVRLGLIMKRLAPVPAEGELDTEDLRRDFRELLCRFNSALLDKLLANERKYGFGDSWKLPDWEEQLQRDLVKHIDKGDPRDVAIYALFAWHHQWPTAPKEEADWQLEARTERNMEVIGAFVEHVKNTTGTEISEETVLSFFNA